MRFNVRGARFWRAGNVHRERKKSRVIPEGEKACSICRDGLCNALTRSARLAATGCAQATPEGNSAAIAALRSVTFRRPSAHACGCVPARWAVTVHRAARQDDSGNHRERSSGPLVPVPPGRAVPASSTANLGCAVFAISNHQRIPDDLKTWTAMSGCPTKTCSELRPEMGRAAGRGAGRSWGMGKIKKGAVETELLDPIRGTRQTQEDQYGKHRDADCGNHRRPRSG